MAIASVNPFTGETLKQFESLTESEVRDRIQKAADAFREYRRIAFSERSRLMLRAAEVLDGEREQLARIATTEMGKPIQAARDEVSKCAWACRFYAENAERFLADEVVQTAGQQSYIRYQPLGVILAIMPWNFPFWQVFRFAAPALMAGNVGLLKHAANVPECALTIERVLDRAGFPSGVFQALLMEHKQVPAILADDRVAAATLTGSVGAGTQVASEAGRWIKKTVLELGGSDPFIVMPSADLNDAVATAVKARVINNGQSCIAAKRFIVAEPIAERFEQEFAARMAALKVGDPMDETTAVGPLATRQVLETLERQVQESVRAGARVLTGGKRINGRGYFYEPTVLTGIPRGTPAYRDEIFGPVASIFRAANLSESIRLANDTNFGLAASVWTRDDSERSRLIDEIETGLVFVNGMVVSDPRLPFGGTKQSGYGRELGVHGIREFVNIKTVCIKTAEPAHAAKTE